MTSIGIVGAGSMGRGIAHAAALSGFDVMLNDISTEILRKGLDHVSAEMKKSVEKGKVTHSAAEEALKRIRSDASLDRLSGCSLVIESAVENIEIKQSIFRKLESVCDSQTILASNTSSLSITSIASALAAPERAAGMHFFNPAHIMKLVEVVRGHRTSDETISSVAEFARKMGKTPVVAKDTPGFIVNRVARPFYGEALRLLGEGVAAAEEIDRIARLEGGFRMGPFELMDLIGIDVNLAVTQSIYEQTFGEPRYRPHIIQKNMVGAGLLGRKSGRGFYSYPK